MSSRPGALSFWDHGRDRIKGPVTGAGVVYLHQALGSRLTQKPAKDILSSESWSLCPQMGTD